MANWIGVITNGGNDLLNEWVSERELRFDSAAAGSGTVAVASMMAQTALAAQKQEASIIGADKVDGGVRLKLRVSAHETGYTLNQYGVWASLTGGDSILVALFQHEQGIQVPSKNESPDFVYTFYALIGCSNTGTWTVNIDTSAVVSGAEMDRAIAEATNGLQPKITASALLKGDGNGNITAAAGGTDYARRTLSGSGAPTEATKGETMQRYYDTSAEKEYVCTGQGNDGKYVWKLAGTGNEVSAHASNHATGGSDPITPASIGAIPSSDKGKAGGVATLDSSGKVPSGQIPSLEYAGKTHASQHATGGSDPITPESIGAAPAGYGLGRNNGKSISNCNDAIQNGWYVTDGNTTNGPVNPANSSALNYLTLLVSSGAERIRQIAFVATQNYYEAATRYSSDSGSTWSEWEWINPHMSVGLEYRTTERYKGKSIYKKTESDGVIKWRVDGEDTWHSDKPISKSVTLSASGWDSSAKTQTITLSGVLADEAAQLITPAPALASQAAYYDAVILCTGQAADQLTFTAKKIPTDDLTVYVTIQEVGA